MNVNSLFNRENYTVQKMSNISAVLYGKEDLRIEDHPLSEKLLPDDVKLNIKSVGVCGTDVHIYDDGGLLQFQGSATVLGHEASAVVTEVGSNVKHLKIGDRVAMDPQVGCRNCWKCKEGMYNLCHTKIHGIPPTDGYLTHYLYHTAENCHKLPENVSLEEGALVEPLGVAVHACNRARFKVGSTVLICGAGTVGLLVLMTIKAAGASTTAVIDLDPSRLELAKRLGADCIVQTRSDMPAEGISEEINKVMDGAPKVVFECSGATKCVQTSIHAVGVSGTIVLIGFGSDSVDISLTAAIIKQVDIVSVAGSANCFPTAIAMIANGQVNVKPLITHKYRMEQIMDAFSNIKNQIGIKTIINI